MPGKPGENSLETTDCSRVGLHRSLVLACSAMWRAFHRLATGAALAAPVEEIEYRRAKCTACRCSTKPEDGGLGQCLVCRCWLGAKTMLGDEHCPRGHW